MTTKTKAQSRVLLGEEHLHHTEKKLPSSHSCLRFIVLTASLAFVFTVIFYAISSETEDDFYSLIDLDSIEQTTPSFVSSSTYKPPPLRKGSFRKFFRRRRFADDSLDPLESEFNDLRAKIRDKRKRVELSKLEQEYEQCKRQTMKRSDCMETFVKMYKLAKEVSAKMEKMKKIFRDSEMHLSLKSMSSSMEEEEKKKATTQTMDAEEIRFSTDEVKVTVEVNKASSGTEASITTIESHSTLKASTGGDHRGTEDALLFGDVTKEGFGKGANFKTQTTFSPELNATTPQKLKDLTTDTRQTTPMNPDPSTVPQSFADVTSKTHSTPSLEWKATTTAQTSTETRQTTFTTPQKSTTVFRPTNPSDLKSFTVVEELTTVTLDVRPSTSIELNVTTEGPHTSAQVTAIDGDTTIDWGDIATVTTTNATTGPHIPEERAFGPKGLTLKNHTSSAEITYRGKCGLTNFEYKTPSECPSSSEAVNSREARETTPLPKPPTKKKDQPSSSEDHPLDFPSSKENMLDEHLIKAYGDRRPAAALNDTRDEWMEIFKTDADRQQIEPSVQPELMDSFGHFDHTKINKFGPKMNPTKNPSSAVDNPQLMTLCEHLAKQFRDKAAQEAAAMMTSTPSTHFTSRGPGFPVTGETMKASAQFLANQNFGVPSIPVCFYITPASFRMMMQPFWSPFFGMGFGGGGGGGGGSHTGNGGGVNPNGGIFIVPPTFGGNMHNNGNFFSNSGPSGSGSQNVFSKSAQTIHNKDQKEQQFFCTYMQDAGGQTPTGGFSNFNFKLRSGESNETSPIDIVYSSYWSRKSSGHHGVNLGQRDRSVCRIEDDVPCYGGGECVPEKKWCDSTVDCSDGSDEAACTCRDRIPAQRICDGYQDCPLGEDEIGCFGCGRTTYSCYDNAEEFESANRSSLAMCYSAAERCDGAKNCINGRDETGCNLIVSDLTHHMSHAVSSSVGYLYRNHQGSWYPVCNNALRWAREACTEELGPLAGDPMVTFQEVQLPGPFIEPHHFTGAHFPQSCQKRERGALSDHAAHVRCPLPKCGIVQESTSPLLRSRRRRRSRRDTAEKDRIVGGHLSKPLQWPFIVAIYRHGEFHCGGTIFSDQWIITAAHCTLSFHKYFYEVRAGMLRRSSFASSTQIHRVTHVVVHQEYDRRTMRNDIALLRIDTPLRYNRWVKPICLPDKGRTTAGNDWIWGPETDTVCTVVGWGAIREKGPGSDPLKEVQLPIRKMCPEKDDQDAEDICAGEVVGGRDACQGDSGGPMFCRSVSNDKEWYLAGVVSHGNGCARAREFGVYTRVALYLDWIEMAMRPELLPKAQPRQMCPGYVCIWGGKRCIASDKRCDRLVDCLGGEDEMGCVYNFIPDVGASANASTSTEANELTATEADESTLIDANALTLREASASTSTEASASTSTEASASTSTEANASSSTEASASTSTEATTEGIRAAPKSASGADTEPQSLEMGDEETTTAREISTTTPVAPPVSTEGVPSGLKSLVDLGWFDMDEETTKLTTDSTAETTTSSTPSTTTQSSPKSTEAPTSTTALPTSTAEVTKLQDLAVKFLDTLEKTTTSRTEESSTTEKTDKATTTTTPSETSTEPVGSSTPSGSSATTFGKSKSDLNADSTESPTTTHAPEKTTEGGPTTVAPKTMPKSIFQKFVCRNIPQIIDDKNRCDRITDCEDGTDEDDCTCQEYLKGPLRILVCDGKADCDDGTDEDNCGNCTATQFLCPVSKTCIDLSKRCDSAVDCQFKEDEKDCFALTNGREIHLDANKQPLLHNTGIFSRNTRGTWRVVCSYETDFHSTGVKTADEVCSLLGFRGSRFYNTTRITHHTIVPIEPDFVQAFLAVPFPVGDGVHFTDGVKHMAHYRVASSGTASGRIEDIEKMPADCLGLFVECAPRAKGSAPLKTIAAGDEISPKTLDIPGHKLSIAEIFGEKRDEILDKLNKLIETKKAVLVHDKLHEGVEKWHWPWLVDVYANGVLWCVGVLVDKHWVLVHESCYNGVRLDLDYVTVLLGGGKSKDTKHKSPHEQIKRVDCFEAVEGSNTLLLHLDYAAHFTRHVLPTFLPDMSVTGGNGSAADHGKQRLECMSVVHDKFGGIRVTPTERGQQPRNNETDSTCGGDGDVELSCYRWNPTAIVEFKARHMADDGAKEMVATAEGSDAVEVKSLPDFCKDLDSSMSYPHNQGVIVCREDDAGWYPMAFYTYNASECDNLQQPFPVRTLERFYAPIQDIIDQPKCMDTFPRPLCLTLRCPLGNCLLPEQLCNGKVDCHDGSDEEKEFCRLRRNECRPSEFKCRSSGKCVPKNKFCDHIADCEDLTDEPTICSCFTYLQATDPGKICDGIRNCWDKSDESSVLCNCTADRFPCGSSPSECIPKDFVCDKEPDCPNGEDEQFCYGIEHPITSPASSAERPSSSLPVGYGQVIEQSYGVWHTKCFPRKRPPNSTEVAEICRKLGYHVTRQPSYRLIDDSLDIVAAANIKNTSDEVMGKYRDATKAVVVNKFSPLHLNEDLTLILKPSRPITELVKWNETDTSSCYRLEVKCA